MELIAGPAVVERPLQHTLGIRVVTPFRGMISARDSLWKEVDDWMEAKAIPIAGSHYLRLHVIDMAGEMDIEAGVTSPAPREGDGRVAPGAFPAGAYATLTYSDHSIRANRLLIDWSHEQGIAFDRDDSPAGDRFRCRYELNLTDPRTERRRKRWQVQLNFLTRPA